MNRSQRAFLAGVLPGEDGWPCAADLDLGDAISEFQRGGTSTLQAWDAIGEFDFPQPSDPEGLQQRIRVVEEGNPQLFGEALVLVYGAYYAHPDVRALIAQRCGYSDRTPQPLGRPVNLEGPDPQPWSRGEVPRWRSDGTAAATWVRQKQEDNPDRSWTEEEIAAWPTL